MILSTLASYFGQFGTRYHVNVMGVIPTGFPSPSLPAVHLMPQYFSSAFSIAIVAFVVSIAMSKLFAKKHAYEIDSNQVGTSTIKQLVSDYGNIGVDLYFAGCKGNIRDSLLSSSVDIQENMYMSVHDAVLVACDTRLTTPSDQRPKSTALPDIDEETYL